MHLTTRTFGLTQTNPFSPIEPRSVGLRTGAAVDAIIINGNRYGGLGGWNVTPTETLRADDYWTEIEIRHGNLIDYLRLRSKDGREIAGGGSGGKRELISGVRLVSISGKSRGLVDELSFEYLEGYQPSAVLERNAEFIIDLTAGGQTFNYYIDQTSRTYHAYEQVTQRMSSWQINASAEVDLIAKFKRAVDYRNSTTNTVTIKNDITNTLQVTASQSQVIANNETALLVCKGDIMRDSDGHSWFAPTSDADWVLLPQDRYKELAGKYDLTGGVEAQTGLDSVLVNGFPKLRIVS